MTDPIADMLTRIKNASLAKKKKVNIPYSRFKFELSRLLEKQGWIAQVKTLSLDNVAQAEIEIRLKYSSQGEPAISGIKRISRPGRRVYKTYSRIPKVLNGLGMAVVSTSLGLMTDKEARQRKVGGEIICEIW